MGQDVNVQLGMVLRKYRESRGYNQSDFAALCGISRAHYGRLELGRHSASVTLCQIIAEALGVHISDLFAELP